MELLNNAYHIREMDLGDLPHIWEKIRCFIGGGSVVAQGWLAMHRCNIQIVTSFSVNVLFSSPIIAYQVYQFL